MSSFYFESLQGIRPKNDDRVAVFENDTAYLSILCDGIGGQPHGDTAAQTIISRFKTEFESIGTLNSAIAIEYFIKNTFDKVHNDFYNLIKEDPSKFTMGSTCVGYYFSKLLNSLVIFNIGDSRCYLLIKKSKKTELKLMTRDHNLLNKLTEENKDSSTFSDSYLRLLVNAISYNNKKHFDVDLFVLDPKSLDIIEWILLTSDGIHEFVSTSKIENILTSTNCPEEATKKIVSEAQKNKSSDNMSIVLQRLRGTNE
ncbi:PP2C family serine/threonine-protein phosphatase [Mycoplasma sp. 4404]|uniref:PP2C family protein-serine/threonine phosphatase n=1 Tax=Mycoplasma sp. 4404 TaxID=3108530 RepID=UPI002B1D6C38|nr:PP2C family serine/threonine-protein phosphatase [Mycoplasma sp. 4404]MEA4162920.1 PP2C family serine/threonine-protein phosphatase [Mycoplasma sp. 4404]